MKTANIILSEDTIKALLMHPECFMAHEYKSLHQFYRDMISKKYQDEHVVTNNYAERLLR